MNRQNGRRKKLKKKIDICFFCREKLNGEKNIHHHPPSSFENFNSIKRKLFKVHYRCHTLYNSIYKYLLKAGYNHEEILQIIQIPEFKNKDFQEKIFKFPTIDLYRFLIFKKKFSIQQIIEIIDNGDIILIEKQRNESNFIPNQINLDLMLKKGIRAAKGQIRSFIYFIKEINKYRL